MAKNEAKIKFTAETSSFNSAIKKANNEMSQLRAEMKLNDTQMKATGASVEGLENKHRILSSQLSASESKTEALNQKVRKAIEIFGDNSEEVTKLRTQLINAQTAEEKLRQAVNACETELEQQRAAASGAGDAIEGLTDKVARQQSELNQLKREYVDAVGEFGEASSEAKQLEDAISRLSGELSDNKTKLSQAADKADELDRSLDGVDESASDAGDGFTVLKGAVADLASEAIQMAIGKISEFIGYLGQLPAETMELRQDLATLTTSFDDMDFSIGTAQETWKGLYAIFGEDDRAVETSNLIAKMADDQKDLNDWTTITTGVWGRFQDSLPVESLAEASMETARTGELVSGLTDALVWAGVSEEDFQKKLDACSTEQERQQLITDTLLELYGESAETYRDTAGAQMEAKEAAADHALAEANLAEALQPVSTAFTEVKTSLLEGMQPAIEKVSDLMVGALDWAKEHPVAMQAIAAAVGVLAVGLTGLGIALGVYAAAQWAANLALAPFALPVLGIVAAIAALVAIIVVLVKKWDDIVSAVKSCWETVKATLSEWGSWIDTNVIQPVVNFFKGLWDKVTSIFTGLMESMKSIWDGICNVVQVAFMLIGSILSAAFQIITLPFRFIWENCRDVVISVWNTIKSAVSTAINAVQNVIQTVMNAIRNVVSSIWNAIKSAVTTAVNAVRNVVSNVWNSIKSVTSTVFNAVKSVASNVWNGIKSTISGVVDGVRSKVSSVFESVKSTVSSVFNGIKSTATSVWNGIKSAIITPIEAAKNKVKSIVDSIKGFFSGMKLSLPKIKLPHFSISGKLSLSPPSVPKLSIKWYKEGGIMTKPTIFGAMGSTLLGGGEAGHEAILPIDKLEGYVANAVERTMQNANVQSLVNAIEDLADRAIELNINGRHFATATAGDADNVNGLRNSFKSRGLALD